MHRNSASFQGAPRITNLEVTLEGQLSGLTAVPAELSAVQQTLRRLDLQLNPDLQIDRAGFDTLLAMPLLEVLDLTGESTESMQWTASSTRYLVTFHKEWQKLHPGAELPNLVFI